MKQSRRDLVAWQRALRQLGWLTGLIVGGYFFIRYLLLPVSPLLLGLAWSVAAHHLARRFPRFMPPLVSALAAVTLVIGTSIAVAVWAVLQLTREVIGISMSAWAWQRSFMSAWAGLQEQWLVTQAELPAPAVDSINRAIAETVQYVISLVNMVPMVVLNTARQLPLVILSLVIGAVTAFLLVTGEPITLRVNRYFSPPWRRRIEDLELAIVSGVGHYLKVQLIIMVAVFLLSMLVMQVARVPHAFLISLVLAVLDLIPVIGPGIILIPWVVVALLMGNKLFAYLGTALYLAILIGRRYSEPRLLARAQVGPSPVGMLAALWLGFYFGGLPGAIGTPLALLVSHSLSRPRSAATAPEQPGAACAGDPAFRVETDPG